METRHDINSIIETIQTLSKHDAEQMIIAQKAQLVHIIFDADALLKATKLLTKDPEKLNVIIEHFPINLNVGIEKINSILEIMKAGQIEALAKKLKDDHSILLKPKDFTKLLKKTGYEKASFILPIISVNFEAITKSKAISDYMLEVFTYGISNYQRAITDRDLLKKFRYSYKDASKDIALLNDKNLTELLRILEPLFNRVTTFNEFYPLFSNFFRHEAKYVNERTLAGDSHYKLKCALRLRFQSLITTQHELNELTKCLEVKKRGEFHKAQHDFWQARSNAPANNNNAFFQQNNDIPSAPPAKELGIAPDYLVPPQPEQSSPAPLASPEISPNNSNNEEQPKQNSCGFM